MKAGRLIRRGLLLAVLGYAAWIGWSAASFRRYHGRAAESKAASPAPRYYELAGVYHMHTRFSDGSGTVEDIAKAAAEAGLDFVVLTDHGAPNRESLAAAGRHRGVLVLAGTEISSNRGHLVAMGFDPPGRDFAHAAEMASVEAGALGGFTVIAHPYSKIAWSWGEWAGYSGLELLNADTEVKSSLPRFLVHAPLLLLKPDAALTALIVPPGRETSAWDRWGTGRLVKGYYAADAHFAYRALFRLFRLRVLLDEPPAGGFEAARRQIFGALQAGRFYSSVEAAAEAGGFRFWAARSDKITAMGSALRWSAADGGGPVRLCVRAPFAFRHEVRLLRDGRPIAAAQGTGLDVEAPGPGTYRVEVVLRERTPLRDGVPWIASNPILIAKDTP